MDQTPDLEGLRERMRRSDAEFERLRHRYYARNKAEESAPTYEELKAAAEAFVAANHEYQKARYGRIRVRLSVSKLLR